MKSKKSQPFLIGIIVLATGSDLLIKEWILKTFINPYPASESISVIGEFFKLTYIRNYGITFGLLSNLSPKITYITLTVISIFALYILYYFYMKLHLMLLKKVIPMGEICIALIFGGALGNLIDRILRGYVVDYLDFGIENYRWYTFNLADVFIVCGCILLMILMSFFDLKQPRKEFPKN